MVKEWRIKRNHGIHVSEVKFEGSLRCDAVGILVQFHLGLKVVPWSSMFNLGIKVPHMDEWCFQRSKDHESVSIGILQFSLNLLG